MKNRHEALTQFTTNYKKIMASILVLIIMFATGCGTGVTETTTGSDITEHNTEIAKEISVTAVITEDPEFGGAVLDVTPDQFNAAGFTLGDSCSVEFSNGKYLEDVPYYNGFFVDYGAPVIVAYPGNDNIIINFNYGTLCKDLGLEDGDTATVMLTEKGKYSGIQETLGQSYSDDITKYKNAVTFCNFRALSGGNIKENYFYRGASPLDNKKQRAAHVDKLLEEKGIKFILNLADTNENIREFLKDSEFNSPYAKRLYTDGKIALLGMNAAYRSDDFKQKLVSGLRQMLENEGPVYIHCLEGKDRTGFVCMILEALAGASYDEMKNDYMLTYDNYFGVTSTLAKKKYEAIKSVYFDGFAKYLHGTTDMDELKKADYTDDAKAYLKSGGMSDDEIEKLVEYICK